MTKLLCAWSIVFGMAVLASYRNGDRDGRIQQRRVDAEEWKRYMEEFHKWTACEVDVWRRDIHVPSTKMMIECGMPPQEPEHK